VQHRYADIVKWYEDLANNNPNIVKYVESIGKSVEGRDQPAVHIAGENPNGNKIYFQCQIHASKTFIMVL
jgi:murein tripeptide amidase MpaA